AAAIRARRADREAPWPSGRAAWRHATRATCAASTRVEADDGGARAAALGRRLPQLGDEGVAREEGPHARPLHALPAAVDHADLDEPRRGGGLEVRLDDREHLGRREGMEVEGVLDRDRDRRVVLARHRATFAPL